MSRKQCIMRGNRFMNSKMIELRITNYVFIVHVLLKLLSVVILLVLSSNVFHNRLTLA